jgi:uncharacterized protein YcaQ
MSRSLSPTQARRIALAAQGLAGPRPDKPVTRRAFRSLATRLGAIQLDSVNVFSRAHYMPAFARLGAYPQSLLEDEAWGKRPSLFEFWGHAAALMPVEMQPLFRWKMERARSEARKSSLATLRREKAAYIDHVLDEVRRRGPVTGGDFAPETKREAGWWNWSDGKAALEWLFWAGLVTTKTRRGFERVYDLTERVIPAHILAVATPSAADAQRELVRIAARAMGVATVSDLADYFRLYQADAKARALELAEAGVLETVSVPGWRGPVFLAVDAKLPRRAPRSGCRTVTAGRPRRRSASTATTSTRSCSASASPPASISRPTARPASCWSRRRTWSRARWRTRWWGRWRGSCASPPAGSGWARSRS